MLSAIISSNYVTGRSVQKGLDFWNIKTLIYKTDFFITDRYDFMYHDGFFLYLSSPTEQHVNFCLHLKNVLPGRKIFILLDNADVETLNTFKNVVELPVFLSPFSFSNISTSFKQDFSISYNDAQLLESNGLKFRLDPSTRLLFMDNNDESCSLKLVNKEFYIMKLLFSNRGKIVSKLDLFENVWGKNLFSSTDTIDVHVSRLRKKLKGFVSFDMIKTVPCIGYILE